MFSFMFSHLVIPGTWFCDTLNIEDVRMGGVELKITPYREDYVQRIKALRESSKNPELLTFPTIPTFLHPNSERSLLLTVSFYGCTHKALPYCGIIRSPENK